MKREYQKPEVEMISLVTEGLQVQKVQEIFLANENHAL